MELDIVNIKFYLKIYIELDFENIEFYIEFNFAKIEFQNRGILLNSLVRNILHSFKIKGIYSFCHYNFLVCIASSK